MYKINMKEEILLKHKDYILNKSDIKNQFLSLKDLEKDKENIKKVLNANAQDEHIKFCEYIIKQVDMLKDVDMSYDKNIFLGQPIVLNNFTKKIEKLFPHITEIFNSSKDSEYKTKILCAMGYERFSGQNMSEYYELEKNFVKKFSTNYIKANLKRIKNSFGVFKYNSNIYRQYLKELNVEILRIIDINNEDLFIKSKFLKLEEDVKGVDIEVECSEFVSALLDRLVIFKKDMLLYEDINKSIDMAIYPQYIKKFNKKKEWGAYNFLMELGLKICPYCNRQYITPIYSENGKMRADLDHFYAKSRYPYLSLSIYNLVPSCKFCNSSLKGIKEFNYDDYLNPYDKAIDDFLKFDYSITSYDSMLGNGDITITMKEINEGDKKNTKKALNNVRDFSILNLYQYHQDIVKGLIKKRIIYNDSYIESLFQSHRDIFKTPEEVINLLIGNIIEDHLENIPLGKLVGDIIDQLDF